jgi:hypothetical protein
MSALNTYPVSFDLGNDTLLCSSAAVNLTIPNNGYSSYEWSAGSNNQSILADTAGVYTVKAYVSGCYVNDTIIITKDTNKYSVIKDSICEGDSLWFGGSFYYNIGNYRDTLLASNGCDSVSTLILEFNKVDSTYIVESICYDDSILFAGSYIYNSGNFIDTLTNALGCDSLVFLNVIGDTVPPVYNCLNNDTDTVYDNCIYTVKDYTLGLTFSDNCSPTVL